MVALYAYSGQLIRASNSLGQPTEYLSAIDKECCNNGCIDLCIGYGPEPPNSNLAFPIIARLDRENSTLHDGEYEGFNAGFPNNWHLRAKAYCQWGWDAENSEWIIVAGAGNTLPFELSELCYEYCKHPSEWETPPTPPEPGDPLPLYLSWGYIPRNSDNFYCRNNQPCDRSLYAYSSDKLAKYLSCNGSDTSCCDPCPDCPGFSGTDENGHQDDVYGCFKMGVYAQSLDGIQLAGPHGGFNCLADAQLCCENIPTEFGFPDLNTPEGLEIYNKCGWDWTNFFEKYNGECKIVQIDCNEWLIYTCITGPRGI